MRFVRLAAIDLALEPARAWRETAARFPAVLAAALLLAALVHAGGVDRYLSERWVVTAVLRLHVPPLQGEGLADRLRLHEAVRRASYHDPEAAWRETAAAYPGIEALRSEGGANPVPGYLEIRLRPGRLTPGDVRALEGTLAALPQVEKVILGSGSLGTLFEASRVLNALLLGGYGLFCLLAAALATVQERGRSAHLLPRLRYLFDRGVAPARLAAARAAGAAATGLLLAAASLLLAWPALRALAGVPFLAPALAPAGETGEAFLRLPVLLFPAATALVFAAASYLGWRGACRRSP